ncbi:MAG: family 10 glycosylhydrolase [Acholeplasmataceae bacterium]|nr:family 10 glycosylhydrolase [Acholeplasmataceae bacterium]
MKLYKYKDEKTPINFYNTKKQVVIPKKYIDKPFKAMWISNVLNIDMPTTEDIDAYKDKVIDIFETCKRFNLNAVFFQVRTTNDAFYQSKLNPYSRYLTGKEGKEPPFDVLKWVIEQARQYQIEFHAWCNPYRVSMVSKLSKSEYLDQCDDLNFAKQHRDLVVTDHRGQLILNPARNEVKSFILESMIELATNYDIDGIHFDDYFYPYGGLIESDNDIKEYEQRTDVSQSIEDFRRAQVTEVIRDMHIELKKVNPNLRFGVSPFGIWKNKTEDTFGSNTDPKCSQSFSNEYADSYTWVKEGYIDYIVPQIYWEFGHAIAPFADIVNFWVDAVKKTDVDLYIGHALYRLGNEGEFENPEEIVNQLKYVSKFKEVKGHVFFTCHTFTDSGKTELGVKKVEELFTGGRHK